jgi:hypothetical protein
MMSFEKIPVKKMTIFLGLDARGQMMGQQMSATETTKMFVIPGRMSIVEVTNANSKTVKETPIGPFGWEYTTLE